MPSKRPQGLTTMIAVVASSILVALVFAAHLFSENNARLAQSAFDVSFAEFRLSRAFNILLEAESSQRGYLLTGDDSYLEPFPSFLERAQSELDDADAQMARLDIKDFGPALGKLRETIERKLSELEQTIALAKGGRTDEALQVVRGNLGRDLMAQAREIVTGQLSLLAGLRAQRVGQAQASARQLTMLTTLGVIAVVLLSLIGVRQLRNNSAELSHACQELASAHDALEDRVGERTRDLQTANEEIQRYAYIVSHDLRAPLVNIVGFTNELASAAKAIEPLLSLPALRGDDPAIAEARRAVAEDIPEALKFIELSTRRMDTMISAILSLSRLGRLPLQPEDIDLEALTRTCVASVQHRLRESGATIAIEGRLPPVVGDIRAMEQMLGNLLDNAAKYLSPERPGRIVVRGRREGSRVVIEVEDNGRGVAPADQERIFELFRRAGRQDQPGDGIGLAHVRSLARRLGGDITVKSDGGTGSLFSLALPSDLRRALAEGHVNG